MSWVTSVCLKPAMTPPGWWDPVEDSSSTGRIRYFIELDDFSHTMMLSSEWLLCGVHIRRMRGVKQQVRDQAAVWGIMYGKVTFDDLLPQDMTNLNFSLCFRGSFSNSIFSNGAPARSYSCKQAPYQFGNCGGSLRRWEIKNNNFNSIHNHFSSDGPLFGKQIHVKVSFILDVVEEEIGAKYQTNDKD